MLVRQRFRGQRCLASPIYPLNVGKISYTVSCEDTGGCPRYYDDGTDRASAATIKIFGTRGDHHRPERPEPHSRRPAGQRRLAEAQRVAAYDASDTSGIRAVRLDMAGLTPPR